jgi:hypothetical protein
MRRGGGFPGFFDFHTNKEVQSGPQHDDGGELTDLIPGRRNGGSQDVRSKLEFQGQGSQRPNSSRTFSWSVLFESRFAEAPLERRISTRAEPVTAITAAP